MKRSKRFVTLILVLTLTLGLSAQTAAENDNGIQFTDVSGGSSYCNAVLFCVDRGLMQGVTGSLFAPDAPLTRAQLAFLLYHLAGVPDVGGLKEPFADVIGSFWARDAIVWVYNSGFMTGITSHFFVPSGTVSRAQMVSALYLYSDSPATEGGLELKDAACIPSIHKKAVSWAYNNDLVTVFGNKYFNSALPVTRAQAAAIAQSYCSMKSEAEEEDSKTELRVVTYNISHCLNYNTGETDYDAFAEYLKALDADIIALNEVRGEGILPDYDEQAAILAEKLGYYYYFAKAIDLGPVASYGNAVLTRLKIKSCETICIPDLSFLRTGSITEPRCQLKLTLVEPDLTILVSHFGLSTYEQTNAVKTVLKNIPEGSCIFMGDLNVTPDNEVLAPIRERLCDTAAVEQELYTYPADAPNAKLDYIFVSENISVSRVYVPKSMVSDHLPLIADIKIKANDEAILK